MNTKGFPIRMWAVCYPDIAKKPGWVPYSGSIYHFREDAEREASGTTNAIMSVMVYPTGYVRNADSAESAQ